MSQERVFAATFYRAPGASVCLLYMCCNLVSPDVASAAERTMAFVAPTAFFLLLRLLLLSPLRARAAATTTAAAG
jgi:hypothetical protein